MQSQLRTPERDGYPGTGYRVYERSRSHAVTVSEKADARRASLIMLYMPFLLVQPFRASGGFP
eukprot:1736361-Rhodomonas_salina.1